MNKTFKMSSFLLMLGLGCMLLYVTLNIFNIPMREGLKGKKNDDAADGGLSSEEQEKSDEMVKAESKEIKKMVGDLGDFHGKYFKSADGEYKQQYNDKCVPSIIELLKLNKVMMMKALPKDLAPLWGRGQVNEAMKKKIDNVEYLDKAIKLLDSAGRAGGGNSAAQSMGSGMGF